MIRKLFALLLVTLSLSANAANEIGYWNGGAGAVSQGFFGGDSAAPVGTAVHAAGSGETITAVRIAFRGTNLQTSCKIALFATSAGLPTGSPIYTAVTISGISGAGTYSASVSWALTNGVSYALAVGECDSLGNFSSDSQANGTSYDDVTGSLSSFTHRSYKANRIELAGDITTAASSNVPLLMQQQSMNAANDDEYQLVANSRQ